MLLICSKVSLSDKAGLCFGASLGELCKQCDFKEKFEKVGWVSDRLSQALVLMKALSQRELAQLQKELNWLCPCLLGPPPVHPLPSISPGVCAATCELGS